MPSTHSRWESLGFFELLASNNSSKVSTEDNNKVTNDDNTKTTMDDKTLPDIDTLAIESTESTEAKEGEVTKAKPITGEAYLCHDMVPKNTYFKHAQDHLPLAYAVVTNFLSDDEIHCINEFFRGRAHPAIKRTCFQGDDIDDSDIKTLESGEKAVEPEVFQLYANGEPFIAAFPAIYQRLLAAKDAFGRKLGVREGELEEVTFPQDIRHITYEKTTKCQWHRDDPTNTFNTIMMCAQPGVDFEGGQLQFHPSEDPVDVKLNKGDAVLYCTPTVEHAVTETTSGVRKIFLVELKRESLVGKI